MSPERANLGNHAAHVRGAFCEPPFISHEWEELVEKLTASADPELHKIGLLEQESLKMKKLPLKVF